MRRSVSSRLFALVVAAWFAALTTELPALHACPVHDMMASGMQAHMMPAGHDHEAHMSRGSHDHQAGHQSPSPGHHDGHCTCLGCGCCGAVTTLPSALPTLAFAPPIARRAEPAPERDAARPAAPQRRLPPAIGPPAPHDRSLT